MVVSVSGHREDLDKVLALASWDTLAEDQDCNDLCGILSSWRRESRPAQRKALYKSRL